MEPYIREFLVNKLSRLEQKESEFDDLQRNFNTGVQIKLFNEALIGLREIWYTAIAVFPSGPRNIASKDFREFCEQVSELGCGPDHMKAWFNLKIHGEFKDYYAIEIPRRFYKDFLTV